MSDDDDDQSQSSSSSSFSSDEDVALSSLGGKKLRPQINDDDDDDDDDGDDDDDDDFSPASDDNAATTAAKDDALDDDDDDDSVSSDDAPLSALRTSKSKKKTAPQTKKQSPKKKKSPAKTPAAKKKKTLTKKGASEKKKSATMKKKKGKSAASASASYTNDGEFTTVSACIYANTQKGKLVRHVLCRWWYAYLWPDPSAIPETVPPNCDSLEGFPGVYVHTSGDNVGQVLDFRDKSTCPNFINFIKKDSSELKELLVDAIGKQKEALIEVEGPGTATERELDKLLGFANKLNAKKADQEAAKLLKTLGVKLPP